MRVASVRPFIFVDGNYLRSKHAKFLSMIYGLEYQPSFLHVPAIQRNLNPFTGTALALPEQSKLYYYDALATPMESDFATAEEFSKAMRGHQELETYLKGVQALDDVQLRLGSVTVDRGERKVRRQAEVDVLLASDVMTFAYKHVISDAILVTGDLDFRPLVEAVAASGIRVTVASDKFGSDELLDVADRRRVMGYPLYRALTDPELANTLGEPRIIEASFEHLSPERRGLAKRIRKDGSEEAAPAYEYQQSSETIVSVEGQTKVAISNRASEAQGLLHFDQGWKITWDSAAPPLAGSK